MRTTLTTRLEHSALKFLRRHGVDRDVLPAGHVSDGEQCPLAIPLRSVYPSAQVRVWTWRKTPCSLWRPLPPLVGWLVRRVTSGKVPHLSYHSVLSSARRDLGDFDYSDADILERFRREERQAFLV